MVTLCTLLAAAVLPRNCCASFYFASSPEKIVNIFFVFAWEFCIEKWRGFLVNFFWSPFPTKRSTKTPQKFRGKFGEKFGAKSRTKFEKFGELSFCDFSDLTSFGRPLTKDNVRVLLALCSRVGLSTK